MLLNQSFAKKLMLKRSIIRAAAVVMLVCVNSVGQSNTGSVQQFAKDGLRFDHPSGWTLKDNSDSKKQYIRLEFDNSSALIMIIADRDLIGLPEYLPALVRNNTEPFIADTTLKFGGASVTSENLHIALKNTEANGVRLRGTVDKEPVSAEVYSFVERSRFINLIYLRPDKDAAACDHGFAIVRNTLSIDPHKIDPPSESDKTLRPKLLKFAKPAYPKLLAQSRLRGTVTVKVIIDEEGNVIDAMATSGPKEFFDNSIAAAHKAKFTPTRNYGYPVKVSGVIQYNFEAPVSFR